MLWGRTGAAAAATAGPVTVAVHQLAGRRSSVRRSSGSVNGDGEDGSSAAAGESGAAFVAAIGDEAMSAAADSESAATLTAEDARISDMGRRFRGCESLDPFGRPRCLLGSPFGRNDGFPLIALNDGFDI